MPAGELLFDEHTGRHPGPGRGGTGMPLAVLSAGPVRGAGPPAGTHDHLAHPGHLQVVDRARIPA